MSAPAASPFAKASAPVFTSAGDVDHGLQNALSLPGLGSLFSSSVGHSHSAMARLSSDMHRMMDDAGYEFSTTMIESSPVGKPSCASTDGWTTTGPRSGGHATIGGLSRGLSRGIADYECMFSMDDK